MLEKAKAGDCVRVNNMIFKKTDNGYWVGATGTMIESAFARYISKAKSVDYLFSEEKVEEKPEVVVKSAKKSPKRVEFVDVSNEKEKY